MQRGLLKRDIGMIVTHHFQSVRDGISKARGFAWDEKSRDEEKKDWQDGSVESRSCSKDQLLELIELHHNPLETRTINYLTDHRVARSLQMRQIVSSPREPHAVDTLVMVRDS